MVNLGIAPPDFSSAVGQFRLIVGDVSYIALLPPEEGFGDFRAFSDDEIEGYLALNDDNVYRAAGSAYMALASLAAQNAQSIKDFDLQVDARQKSEALALRAAWFYGKADEIDGEETFQIVSTGRRRTRAELAEVNWSEIDLTDYIL